MWLYVKTLVYRGWHEALANGSSTGISVFWLGFGVLVLGFVFTVGIEWFTGGRNMPALLAALKSWKSWAAAALALLFGWLLLLGYSTLAVAYRDHQDLLTAQAKSCPVVAMPKVNSQPAKTDGEPPKAAVRVQSTGGIGNTANPGTNTAPITQAPCAVFQNGGSNNTSSPTCVTPAWKLTDPQVDSIKAALAGTMVNFDVVSTMDDPEATRLAAQLRTVLSEAGWNLINKGPVFRAMGRFDGTILNVSDVNFPAAATLQLQLRAANIPADGAIEPRIPANTIELLVGHPPAR